MTTILRESDRVAAKVHHCDMCGVMVKIGERHHVTTQVYDGRVYDWRTCEPCFGAGIVHEVWMWAGQPDEGVDGESATDWAHDVLSGAAVRGTDAEAEIARAYLIRRRCGCERCETAATTEAPKP